MIDLAQHQNFMYNTKVEMDCFSSGKDGPCYQLIAEVEPGQHHSACK